MKPIQIVVTMSDKGIAITGNVVAEDLATRAMLVGILEAAKQSLLTPPKPKSGLVLARGSLPDPRGNGA